MKTEDILRADHLDLLFDGRHKAYGAYELRRQYPNRIKRALLLVLMGMILLSAWLLYKPVKQVLQKPEMVTTVLTSLHPDEPLVAEKPKAPESKPKPKPKPIEGQSQQFVANIQVVKTATAPIKNLIDSIAIDRETRKGPVNPPVIPQPPTVPGSGPAPVVPEVPSTPAGPVEMAEVMPAFPGGMDKLRQFLERNLQTPGGLESGETVTVKMKFVVGYDGVLRGFETIQDGGTAFNNEVVRVLKKMPDWVPGRSNGRNVSVYYVLPVTFTAGD